jgi:hypothetical protein
VAVDRVSATQWLFTQRQTHLGEGSPSTALSRCRSTDFLREPERQKNFRLGMLKSSGTRKGGWARSSLRAGGRGGAAWPAAGGYAAGSKPRAGHLISFRVCHLQAHTLPQ